VPTKLILTITFLVLFWNLLLYPTKSQTPTTQLSPCEGLIHLTLSPNHGYAGDTITASVSGLKSEGCLSKRIYIKESSCKGLQYCSCMPNSIATESYGCVCTFRAPMPPYFPGKESSRQAVFTYYACADLNDNGIFEEVLGEQDYTNLIVYSRYAPLSLVTESIFIIITLGVLLSIAIVVFRLSMRRR